MADPRPIIFNRLAGAKSAPATSLSKAKSWRDQLQRALLMGAILSLGSGLLPADLPKKSGWSFVAQAAAQENPASAAKKPKKGKEGAAPKEAVHVNPDPFPSTYKPLPSGTMLIRNAVIFDGNGGMINSGDLLMQDGKIAQMGAKLDAPAGAKILDAQGRYVTPGIIDAHSHLGVYASPGLNAHSDGNEATSPNTAEVWAEHSVWPQDPGFQRARAGGVTAMQILPGSANLVGGRGVTTKNVPSLTVQGMKFPDAPYTVKMACGENPKRVYGDKSGPSTRMGNVAGYRAAWIKAKAYNEKWDKYYKAFAKNPDNADAPDRDLQLETLGGVLRGEILVQMHCYRADEMAQILDIAKEFGYKITAFHHAVESYKLAPVLAKEGICSMMWADWWGFKLEAYDAIRENIPFVHAAGACAVVHSDSADGIQRLNQEAAKALADGRRAGIDVSDAEAWKWLSANPARALGIFDKTGSLSVGKNADIVIWSRNPLSVYALADQVFVDGALVYDRLDPTKNAVSDFELGQIGQGGAQ